jgi:hypothetical protein
MPKGTVLSAIVAMVLLVALVALRGLSKGNLEVKLTDAIIAILPIVIWLVASGQITKLAVSPEGITVETAREAILKASSQPIEAQVSPLPVDFVEEAAKGGSGLIAQYVENRVQALGFIIKGNIFYVGSAIKTYLNTLNQYPFFKYIIVKKSDRSLFGVVEARQLTSILDSKQYGMNWDAFAEILNTGTNLQRITALPGFVGSEIAVSQKADKRAALAKMERLSVDWLPVVNPRNEFVGVVDRSRLTASLVLDVATSLKESEN